MHPADLRHRYPSEHNDHDHLQRKLKKVSDQHAPQPADECVNPGEWDQHENANRQRGVVGIAKRVMPEESQADTAAFGDHRAQNYGDDADHGSRHPSQDEAVHKQSEIDGFKSAQESGRLAAIADFAELHVGENFGAPPVAREKENRQHAAHAEAPPDPVSGNPLPRNRAAHEQWRVGGKRCGDHRRPGQPP